jgi:hypothetical protein
LPLRFLGYKHFESKNSRPIKQSKARDFGRISPWKFVQRQLVKVYFALKKWWKEERKTIGNRLVIRRILCKVIDHQVLKHPNSLRGRKA